MHLTRAKTILAANATPLVLLALLIMVGALRVAVIVRLPIWLQTGLIADDGSLLRAAVSLADGDWLGPYGPFTLLHGPGYPAFLVLSGYSGLPVSAAHALFQTAAIGVAAWAVWRLTASALVAGATFVALAFLPAGIMPELQRVSVAQIYWAQVLVVFSLAVILLLAPPRRPTAAIVLSALTGAILGWTWLTQANSAWLLPGLAVLAAGALLVHRETPTQRSELARRAGIAAAAFLVVITAFMTANLLAYGFFQGADANERHYQAALRALRAIEAGPEIANVTVSKAARAEAAKVSPTFRPIETTLNDGHTQFVWSKPGCWADRKTCGEYASGYFARALRVAAAKNGYYESPQTAASKFAAIAAEIGAACADGRLRCRAGAPGAPPEGPGTRWGAALGALETASAKVAFLDPPADKAVPTTRADLDDAAVAPFRAFLNEPLLSEPGKDGLKMTAVGWYRHSDSVHWPSFAVYAEDGTLVPSTLRRIASPDLQKGFGDSRVGWNRFAITFRCPDRCTLAALPFNRPALRVPITHDYELSATSEGATLYVDVVTHDWKATANLTLTQTFAAQARTYLAGLYQSLVPYLLLAGLVAMVAACDGAIGTGKVSPALVAALAAWVLVGTRIVLLAWPDAGEFAGSDVLRAVPGTYLLILATFLNFGAVVAQARLLSPFVATPAPA